MTSYKENKTELHQNNNNNNNENNNVKDEHSENNDIAKEKESDHHHELFEIPLWIQSGISYGIIILIIYLAAKMDDNLFVLKLYYTGV